MSLASVNISRAALAVKMFVSSNMPDACKNKRHWHSCINAGEETFERICMAFTVF
jgi:hypothetical protein